jgi:hypothetical protein
MTRAQDVEGIEYFREAMGTWPLGDEVLAIAPESSWRNIIVMMMDHDGVRWTSRGCNFNYADRLKAIDAHLMKSKHLALLSNSWA